MRLKKRISQGPSPRARAPPQTRRLPPRTHARRVPQRGRPIKLHRVAVLLLLLQLLLEQNRRGQSSLVDHRLVEFLPPRRRRPDSGPLARTAAAAGGNRRGVVGDTLRRPVLNDRLAGETQAHCDRLACRREREKRYKSITGVERESGERERERKRGVMNGMWGTVPTKGRVGYMTCVK